MKKYDREKKRWVEESEIIKKADKRKLCRGGKPHDWVTILPQYVTYTEAYDFNPEPYYESEERVRLFLEAEEALLKSLGIVNRYSNWRMKRLRYKACTVCDKREYEDKD